MELKRPKILDAQMFRFKQNGVSWIAFVGIKEGRPFEVFTAKEDAEEGIIVATNPDHLRIEKKKIDNHHTYILSYRNKRNMEVKEEGLEEVFDKEIWNYSIMLSGLLRHEVPVDKVIKIVKSLRGVSEWSDAITTVLTKLK